MSGFVSESDKVSVWCSEMGLLSIPNKNFNVELRALHMCGTGRNIKIKTITTYGFRLSGPGLLL